MRPWCVLGFSFLATSTVVRVGVAAATPPACGCDPAEDSARITAHLTNVATVLAERDVDDLEPAQREARRAGLAALRAYVAEGVYPHNTDFPGELVPYFIDDEGRDCAVGRILIASGGAELA